MSAAKVLVVEDDAGLREALVDTLLLSGYQCTDVDSGEQALLALKDDTFDIVVSDIQMPGMDGLTLLRSIRVREQQLPVLLMTAYANVKDAVTAMQEGATDYIAKPFAPEVLLNQVSRYAPVHQVPSRQPVVADPASCELLALAKKVAQSDASVMVLGPSGSGKEVLARYIHDQSARSVHPFVAINCAAIPENMLEATLFGYEKGAFTGAIQACPGKFEQAMHGTILLDEVTEMDMGLQAKLLRVLQEREVERLGSRKTIKLDVRVLATSNRDLRQAVADGKFREDLFYRLNVFPLSWLPLNARPVDIVPLAEHLLARHCQKTGSPVPTLTPDAKDKLTAYQWPGNVRELDNVMQRALILRQGDQLSEQELIIETDGTLTPPSTVAGYSTSSAMSYSMPESSDTYAITPSHPVNDDEPSLGAEMEKQETQIILTTLEACAGRRSEVAKRLGISPRTLRYKLAKMRDAGIELPV